MSSQVRTLEEIRISMKCRRDNGPKNIAAAFDKWAPTYDEDINMMKYQAPNLVAELIDSHFSGRRDDAKILDVACGTGLVAAQLSRFGFKHFVGIDCSQEMLKEASKSGFYVDLKQVKLGPEPVPAPADTFDVVTLVGGLQSDLVPLSALKDLCHVTKPGGLICLTRAQQRMVPEELTVSFLRELQLLEEKGIWTCVEKKRVDRFMKDTSMVESQDNDGFITGTIHLFKRSLIDPAS